MAPKMDTEAKGSTSPYVVVGLRTLLSPWCGVGYPYDIPKDKQIQRKRRARRKRCEALDIS